MRIRHAKLLKDVGMSIKEDIAEANHLMNYGLLRIQRAR